MSPIVGREAELAVVEGFLAEDDRGARTLAIAGEPGIGKTTVWREALRRARERAAVVLVAAPAESEARLSFAGLTDLLSPVAPERFAALPAPQQQALAVALLRTEAARPPERRLVGTALLSLLRELATDGEVVLAIDDVQWLDPPSASAIEFAARRLVDEQVRRILSVRSEQAEASVLAGIAREGRVLPLELGPLSVASLHRIVAEHLGRTFPRPTLHADRAPPGRGAGQARPPSGRRPCPRPCGRGGARQDRRRRSRRVRPPALRVCRLLLGVAE